MTRNSRANLLLLPGDGIGPEVVVEAVRVLEWFGKHRGFDVDMKHGDVGVGTYYRTGRISSEATMEEAMTSDAVLMGAIGGGPEHEAIPQDIRRNQGIPGLRRAMKVYANIRPVKAFAALSKASPIREEVTRGVDMISVRELIGGIYFGEPRYIGRPRVVIIHGHDIHERPASAEDFRTSQGPAMKPAAQKQVVGVVFLDGCGNDAKIACHQEFQKVTLVHGRNLFQAGLCAMSPLQPGRRRPLAGVGLRQREIVGQQARNVKWQFIVREVADQMGVVSACGKLFGVFVAKFFKVRIENKNAILGISGVTGLENGAAAFPSICGHEIPDTRVVKWLRYGAKRADIGPCPSAIETQRVELCRCLCGPVRGVAKFDCKRRLRAG